jgi:hypothetical protein
MRHSAIGASADVGGRTAPHRQLHLPPRAFDPKPLPEKLLGKAEWMAMLKITIERMNLVAVASYLKPAVRIDIGSSIYPSSARRSPQTPSLPGAGPRADAFRTGVVVLVLDSKMVDIHFGNPPEGKATAVYSVTDFLCGFTERSAKGTLALARGNYCRDWKPILLRKRNHRESEF